jgi:hypothetical protein
MSEMSSHDSHPESRRDYDLVFNAETVRALRRVTRTPQALFVVTLVGVPIVLMAIEPLVSLSPPMLKLLGIVSFVAIFGTGLWAAMPTREVRREVKHAIVWFIARIFGRDHKLPSEYQPEEDDENHDPEPLAVPALVAGRAPLDWAIVIGFPALVAAHVVAIRKVPLGVGLVGCIVLSAFLFHRSRGGLMRPTFSPENPPHGRQRGEP